MVGAQPEVQNPEASDSALCGVHVNVSIRPVTCINYINGLDSLFGNAAVKKQPHFAKLLLFALRAYERQAFTELVALVPTVSLPIVQLTPTIDPAFLSLLSPISLDGVSEQLSSVPCMPETIQRT